MVSPNIEPFKPKVIHLGSIELDNAKESLLHKRLNFAIAPKKILADDVVFNIKVSIKEVESIEVEEIRQDVEKILRSPKPPPRNISKDDKRALIEFRKNKNMVILKVDKGNLL